MILLLDFDQKADKRESIEKRIPLCLKDRVFVLGVWSEPEYLRTSSRKTYEEIGLTLAKECRDDAPSLWKHELLLHNSDEVARMTEKVKPILFPIVI